MIVLPEDIRDKLSSNAADKNEIHDRLERSLKAVNRELDHHEQLSFAVIAKDPWSIENGLLTPTMKIKGAEIEKTYQPYEDDWYRKGEFLIWE